MAPTAGFIVRKASSDQLIRLMFIISFQTGIREQINSYNINGCNISKKKQLPIHRYKWRIILKWNT
jgi:hypothetical protein